MTDKLLDKLTGQPDDEPRRRTSGGTNMFDLLTTADDTRVIITRLLRLTEADAATLAAELDRHPDEVALALERLVARGEVSKRQDQDRWLYRVVIARSTHGARRVAPDLWQELEDGE
ncbi:MAG: hypothetical protein KKA73_27395 [Chloroflexi bacterium]|nr:hypothetical protein [Chloroflexota bacterium]MBU1751422.1 hypothetical protein [Chloroflexota bacterium]MBU1878814.1 hypothetical protein [Chloroflexota bacterium]